MSASTLVCLAPGSEETEAVTTIDLLVRGDIKITTASVANDSGLVITCLRGVKLLANASLVEMTDGEYNVIVLPGDIKGAECFHDNTLLVGAVKRFRRSGRIVVVICAVPVTALIPHDIFPIGGMTGLSTLKDKIPAKQQQDKCAIWDARVKLLTSQGPDTATDFDLKIISLLVGREKAHEVASQLVMTAGIYNYYEQYRIR